CATPAPPSPLSLAPPRPSYRPASATRAPALPRSTSTPAPSVTAGSLTSSTSSPPRHRPPPILSRAHLRPCPSSCCAPRRPQRGPPPRGAGPRPLACQPLALPCPAAHPTQMPAALCPAPAWPPLELPAAGTAPRRPPGPVAAP